jgi:hypothetical protein
MMFVFLYDWAIIVLHLGKPRPLGVGRVLWPCPEIKQGSIGVLENWSIGIKTEDYDVFLFCV